tara:strand:- start:2352 stop:2891 length:540 start_codon:yes stop_codon:yes gene_type:complete
METKRNHPALQTKSSVSTINPLSPVFKKSILKANFSDVVKTILNDKPPTIYRSYKDNEEKAIDILILMLIQFQDFYNCKRVMDKEQLTEIAYMISEEYRHLNYIDLAFCLKRVKAKEKIFDRIDGGLIMGWLRDYDKERTSKILQERQKQKTKEDSEWSGLGDRSSLISLKQYMRKEDN